MSDSIVYVVDDDATVGRALCRLIRSVGLDAVAFSSGQAFLKRAFHDGAACIVLDVRMPGIGGFDLQSQLGAVQQTMPIVFITGHANVPSSVRAMKSGAIDFLQKPFNDDELIDAVQRALALSRQARLDGAAREEVERRMQTLTPREREVLELLVQGLANKQVGAELGAAEKTIKVHRGRVMRKMQAGSIVDLVRMRSRLGPSTGVGRNVLPAYDHGPIAEHKSGLIK